MAQLKKFRQDFTEVKTVTEFWWTLYNISSCNKSVGESITSQMFLNLTTDENIIMHDKAKWQFQLFPKGCSESCKKKVCIVLQSLNDFEVRVEGKLTVLPNSDIFNGVTIIRHVFKGSTLQHGFTKHFDRNIFLVNHQELDELTIRCKMFIVEDTFINNNPLVSLLKDIGSLLQMRKHCDVILKSSDGSEHEAHKAILSCRSKVFAAMFNHDMREKQENLVKIEDLDSETLKRMLKFIYTGEIKNMKCDDLKKLFIAADKYELFALREICVSYFNENLNIDNTLDLYEFACMYNIFLLEIQAKTYFLKNKKQIMLNKGLEYIKSFSRDTIAELLYSSAVC